jgi:restriction system protein
MTTNRGGRAEWERQQQAIAREAERERKAAERARLAEEKEQKQRYRVAREAEIQQKNAHLERRVAELDTILVNGLHRSAVIDLVAGIRRPTVAALDLGPLVTPVVAPSLAQFAPRPPGVLSRMMGGNARYEQAMAAAQTRHRQAVEEAERHEIERQRQVVAMRKEHEARVAQAEQEWQRRKNAVDAHVQAVASRDQASVEQYLKHVLRRVPLPKDFPHEIDVTFNSRADQAIVRIELPPHDIVPTVAAYKYLSTKDEERPTARPKADVQSQYRRIISQMALLCVRDVFDGDPAVQSVGLNGHANAIDPATGEHVYPCLISMDVKRADFLADENLSKVTPEVCVRHLKAIVSNHPYELEPIEPILDFDMSKFRFVKGFDAVATLDSRPDLMDMSPTNFEHLVRQIFEAQGAEGWTTQQSKDDGVDAVIVQRKALMGGLSIVQAKRYSKVIGVSHLRELAGAMEEKKAGWGILITTSWFASGCQQKAREHGRMELIDGERLVYLIKEFLGKDVLIGIPNRPERAGGEGASS